MKTSHVIGLVIAIHGCLLLGAATLTHMVPVNANQTTAAVAQSEQADDRIPLYSRLCFANQETGKISCTLVKEPHGGERR